MSLLVPIPSWEGNMDMAESQQVALNAERRWYQYSLRSLLVLVTVCCMGFSVWSWHRELQARRQSLIAACEGPDGSAPPWLRFSLASEASFTFPNGPACRVLVFDSILKTWPGYNSYKIVVATSRYQLLVSEVFGAQEMLESANLAMENGKPILRVKCRYRRHEESAGRVVLGAFGTTRYELSPSAIKRVGDVVWNDTGK
jgi:hypothetical protein